MSASDEPAVFDGAPGRRAPSRGHVELATLAYAAAATLALARVLPLEFRYRPNELGIVSYATVREYPLQQETFWFVLAVGAGMTSALVLAGLLRRRVWSPGRGLALELAALATAAVGLFCPSTWAWLGWLGAGLGLVLLRCAPPGTAATENLEPEDSAMRSRPLRTTLVALALAGLACLMVPRFVPRVADLARGVPDEALTVDDWAFHGEAGQHLAWADALRAGRLPGRDFFSLYGPYYEIGVVALWSVVGRSLAAWSVYESLQLVLGLLGALVLCHGLARRAWVAPTLVLLARVVPLRLGLLLFAFAALIPWLRGGRRAWCGLAGFLGGFALLYSQEFGLAFLVCAALALAVRADARAFVCFAGGAALPVVPLVAWFAAEGALGPLVRDMAGYPSWLIAGYGKLPFPPLLPALPLDAVPPYSRAAWFLRTAYVAPVVCAGALALAALAAPLELTHPWRFPGALRRAWRARPTTFALALVALFGLISFRSALGRSDETHVVYVLGPAALLVVLGLERALAGLRAAPALAIWRVLLLGALAWFGGLPRAADAPATLRAGAREAWAALRGSAPAPSGSAEVNAVAAWLRAHTTPDDTLHFVPAGAAYLYLTERREATRFVLSHQLVTDAHRAEALRALAAAPPRYVVFDPGALRVDGVPDRMVLGAALSAWLEREYELDTVLHGVRIHRRRAGR